MPDLTEAYDQFSGKNRSETIMQWNYFITAGDGHEICVNCQRKANRGERWVCQEQTDGSFIFKELRCPSTIV